MRHPHKGVLLPAELDNATEAEKDAYAAKVKAGNRAVIEAVHQLEDEAERLGIDLDSAA